MSIWKITSLQTLRFIFSMAGCLLRSCVYRICIYPGPFQFLITTSIRRFSISASYWLEFTIRLVWRISWRRATRLSLSIRTLRYCSKDSLAYLRSIAASSQDMGWLLLLFSAFRILEWSEHYLCAMAGVFSFANDSFVYFICFLCPRVLG
jgi:hypothetical protein